ncbi:helix-turn-helix transcriptional regulator [Thalassotalea ponticola]|uniref:helix-turn-helix domain-containing protein n=1 Tax=Thalassotalea ponticola TaxID=1523392 RepID=UPI0025B2BA18|nr:helix-turn-helix transcriptional regulator [Thalassotalea ponticola]MDN3653436.1 helix-turn-helix transcriptional regulator [Thalassotalea ponticola]
MILAEKIIRLRKQLGWSQEELAEKMSVSRQSISKWESANSIPDLNKIIALAKIFDVSTDFLLLDENEVLQNNGTDTAPDTPLISLEQAKVYVESKLAVSSSVTKGAILCLCSAIPLLFLLAMAQGQRLNITTSTAAAFGILALLVMVSIAVSYFIKANDYKAQTAIIDEQQFDLAYGVHSVFSEKLNAFKSIYHKKLSIGVGLFIISPMALIFAAVFSQDNDILILMLIVLKLFIAAGLTLVIPVSTRLTAYQNILADIKLKHEKSERNKRIESFASFYWPLLTAIYLGWSLWTMDWGITWILWPVGSVLYIALVGLMDLLIKDSTSY